MTTLELVIAGLALIWGPPTDCTGSCPATVYFPMGHGPQDVCGEPLEDKHHLALVFAIEDLERADGGTFEIVRVGGKQYGIEPICHDIAIGGTGLGNVVKKHELAQGCDPSAAGENFDPSSYACVAKVGDVDSTLKPRNGSSVLRQLHIPGGTLKAGPLAKRKNNDALISWSVPSGTNPPRAIANSVVLESEGSGPFEITGTDCNGQSMALTFEPKKPPLRLEISNLPTRPMSPGSANVTRLEHLRWTYAFLEDDARSDCADWSLIEAQVPPGDIITGIGSADVFCPPSSGP